MQEEQVVHTRSLHHSESLFTCPLPSPAVSTGLPFPDFPGAASAHRRHSRISLRQKRSARLPVLTFRGTDYAGQGLGNRRLLGNDKFHSCILLLLKMGKEIAHPGLIPNALCKFHLDSYKTVTLQSSIFFLYRILFATCGYRFEPCHPGER